MRNPDRIKPVCDKLIEIWSKVPDWRFGQLICNFQRSVGNDGFYLEDEDFIKALEMFINENI